MTAVRAAVDVGTNSVRLLVIDGDGNPLAREAEITRLGRGVDATGHLDDDSLAATLDVLARYRDQWRDHGAARVRIAATSAIRDASDRTRFFDAVRELTGVEAEVLSGGDEAATAFAGALGGVDLAAPAVLLDIGGGSTELIIGDRADTGPRLVAACSMQLGAVRLTERCFTSDPPAADELLAARHEIQDQLVEAVGHLDDHGAGDALRTADRLVGVAGTVTTLALVHLGLDGWRDGAVHGTRLDVDELEALAERLSGMTTAQRAAIPGMPIGRADVIAAGALILAESVGAVQRLTRGRVDAVVASETDILDGLAASL